MTDRSKTVLIIAYYFPPSGGAGVQRILKFVKYLPLLGWKPIVLTVTEDADFPIRDESLFKEIPDTVQIVRTKIFEPYDLYRRISGRKPGEAADVIRATEPDRQSVKSRLIEWVRATFFIPDARKFWVDPAVKAGLEIIRNEQVDVIFSSSSPNTCHLIGRELKRRTKIPWVADFRDSWIWLSTPNRWFLPKMIDTAMEKSVLQQSDRVIASTAGVRDLLLAGVTADLAHKFSVITNGYDQDDFTGNDPGQKEKKFVITHTGALYDKRSPVAILQAAELLFSKYPGIRRDFLFRFVGRTDPRYFEVFKKFEDCVEHVPYVEHRASVGYLLRSDVLLLLIDAAVVSKTILTGKIFEYIGARRPILALAPEGDAADLIRKGNAGVVVHPDEALKIADVLYELYLTWADGTLSVQTNDEFVASFERQKLTADLIKVFDSCTKHTNDEGSTCG